MYTMQKLLKLLNCLRIAKHKLHCQNILLEEKQNVKSWLGEKERPVLSLMI